MMKVAVVGTGAMGRIHAAAWSSMPDVQLVALLGRNADQTRRAAAEYGAAAMENWQALLQDEEVAVVDLCIPTPLHKTFTLEAAAHGKHVICEKPIALEEKDAIDMIEGCRKAGVQLYIAHVLRFFPAYAQARRQIRGGALGTMRCFLASRHGTNPGRDGQWYADPAQSGGVLLDLMIHDLDFLRWTFGEVESVFAVGSGGESELCRHAVLAARMKSGMIARLEASWNYPRFESSFEALGTAGSYAESSSSPPLSIRGLSVEKNGGGAVSVPSMLLEKDPYYRQLRHFRDCILLGERPVITAQDALEALKLARLGMRSMEIGSLITMHAVREEEGES
ncbi:Gfo/Idh/MocA family oxidoreductase [Paenibacillus sp. HB172176]|uniref:Gfo/Idh/MocA family protein n=1 Tax=Paenibacillus sp. HB172176 TaxID=2493690 RepID=UPI00143AA4EF|nr:Gfo/Idh/MocA family oxidoreductase [Paenibacillus sp. HB172176]